jgi:hypothetical protein
LPGPFPEGRCALRRKFGYPGRIDAHERVWLVIDGLKGEAAVSLNGVRLVGLAEEADVTGLLRARNEILIDGEGGWGEAALEVRASAYLRDIRVEGGSVTGRVVGGPPRALDLYLIAGRGTADYCQVTPTAEGTAFGLSKKGLEGPYRVELVCGAAVWHVAACEG